MDINLCKPFYNHSTSFVKTWEMLKPEPRFVVAVDQKVGNVKTQAKNYTKESILKYNTNTWVVEH